MRERPILMSAPMVRALLDGRKTMTRRVVKGSDAWGSHARTARRLESGVWRIEGDVPIPAIHGNPVTYVDVRCPYGAPGDLLWVRESGLESLRAKLFIHDATPGHWWTPEDGGRYGASYGPAITRETLLRSHRARPSIHMPRWASRLTLRITDVRVERLQDISADDVEAEGVICQTCRDVGWINSGPDGGYQCPHPLCGDSAAQYRDLWDSINGSAAWDANPWVWVVAFERGEVPGV